MTYSIFVILLCTILVILEQFETMTDTQLSTVEGGVMEWIGAVLGAIGNAAHPVDPRQVVDQLNGKYPRRGPVRSCPPGGTGGTPNAC
ncbi:ComC/BlpC family leader-containing pheromone/bacteriocin [Streptococcus sp. H31]|uniref:ComC/BlpC family leader-containing pheromone/bacteriocin n=1 Tax=Streptococcus huangxiaojuni TaxID=3237239 RepID=UPI0034A50C12